MTRLPAPHATARPRAAVIGSGVSGLTAAHLLQRRYDVTLFEADDRLGGHAHTHDVAAGDGRLLPVDSGFIVHNERTYPSLLRLFSELGVATQPTEMSMSIRCEGCGLEYAGGRGAGAVFAQRRRIADPRFLRLLVDVKRFHRRAGALLADESAEAAAIDLAAFCATGRFSRSFVRHFMVPLVSCVWSAGTDDTMRYPAQHLFRFLEHHGMLTVRGSPTWRTVVGGSRTYVERAAKALSAVETLAPVRTLRRAGGRIEVRDDADTVRSFDTAVVATHADQALALLGDPTSAEQAVLGAFGYSRNETVLHTDTSVLPAIARARASWNYLMQTCDQRSERVIVSYWMNRLQRLDERTDYLVSLNSDDRIDSATVIERMVYEHPVFTREAVAAQRSLGSLNRDGLAFAGAYHGWGFHEDGCVAGVRAAASLGVDWDERAGS